LPLEIVGLSTIEFTELLFEHEERLRHSFSKIVVEEVINNEFEQLVRLISRNSNLKVAMSHGL
jgi:sporulation-control protein spo0M